MKAYTLLKDVPDHKKGTVFQKGLDDGDNPGFLYLQDTRLRYRCSRFSIENIENFTEWFEEIGDMITIKGKKYSEETIHEALKNHIGE